MKNNMRILYDKIPNSIKIFFCIYVTCILLFIFYRLVFILFFYDDFSIKNLWLYCQSFIIGLRLDLIVISYLSVPILLTIFLPIISWGNKYYKYFLKLYVGFVITCITILSSINLEWFNEFGNHVNAMIIMYGAGGQEGWKLVWEEYNIILYFILWVITIYYFYKLFDYLIDNINLKKNSFIQNIGYLIITTLICIIFARGGFQERPLDWGYAHFSRDNMSNQLAQNTLFFLGRSVLQYYAEEPFAKQYPINDRQSIIDTYQNLRDKNNGDRLNISLNSSEEPLPNIILIILESFVSENCNFLNTKQTQTITPNLNKLVKKSISFDRCFANGIRSAYGIGSILCSWPTLPGRPIIKQVEASFKNNIGAEPTRIMENLGYNQIFLYGGDASFDNMKGFAMTSGFNEVIDWEDGFLKNNETGTMWGLFDHIMFDKLVEISDSCANDEQPFMITFFTTTNHDPFRVPQNYVSKLPNLDIGKHKYDKAKLTMAYNDILIEELLQKIKHLDWYDNTIFIITADHGLTVHKNISNHPLNGHIPLIIFSELIDTSITINKIVSQVDIFPTLLDLIGKQKELKRLYGISGLREGPGFACRVTDKQLQWVDSSYVYNEFIGTNKSNLYSYSNIWDEYQIYNKVSNSQMKQKLCRHYIQNAYARYKQLY